MNIFDHSAPSFLICGLSLIFGSGALEILACMATRVVVPSRAKGLCNLADRRRSNAGILRLAQYGEGKV